MAEIHEGITDVPMAFGIAQNDGNGGSGRDEKSRLVGVIKRARVAKGCLEAVIVAACAFWIGWWLLSPDPEDRHKYVDIWIGDKISNSRFFNTDGSEGPSLIFNALPFIVATMLSFVVIELRAFIKAKAVELRKVGGGDGDGSSDGWRTRWRLNIYPVWVEKSPLGIITGAEALGILIILFVFLYHFGRVTDLSFHHIEKSDRTPSVKYWQKVINVSFNFGRMAMLPFALLWIPVSRGSPLLRLLGIPFEQAVRYHIWLATSTMVMLTIHSVGYIVAYSYTDRKHLFFTWVTRKERSVVAGLTAWVIGLVMWITSHSYIRRRFYDLFFRIHHLYLLFSLFWIYHVVSTYHYFVIPMLLFFVDRFIRMVQSTRLVQVSSVKVLANDVVELTMPVNIKGSPLYNALSTWCIQIPGISRLQWHFFSGASSLLDKRQALTIIIKPLGGWTNALRDQVSKAKKGDSASCPFSFKARVEGPYGDESEFYLKYKSLVLVAGGIGITPAMVLE